MSLMPVTDNFLTVCLFGCRKKIWGQNAPTGYTFFAQILVLFRTSMLVVFCCVNLFPTCLYIYIMIRYWLPFWKYPYPSLFFRTHSYASAVEYSNWNPFLFELPSDWNLELWKNKGPIGLDKNLLQIVSSLHMNLVLVWLQRSWVGSHCHKVC